MHDFTLLKIFPIVDKGEKGSVNEYTQYELYGTGYMGHILGLVENMTKNKGHD